VLHALIGVLIRTEEEMEIPASDQQLALQSIRNLGLEGNNDDYAA
jgi:hypothetical protein